jgi:PAS domain S-box-containing protein
MAESWSVARALAVAMFAFFVYLSLLWARRTDQRRTLALALLFLVAGLYDVFASLAYSGSGNQDAIPWRRLVAASADIAAPLFFLYLSMCIGDAPRRALALWSSVFGLLAAAQMLAPGNLVWAHVDKLFSAAINALATTARLAILVHCLRLLARSSASGPGREARGMAWVLAALALAAVNDYLVGLGVYRSIFLAEYAWAASLIYLAYRSADRILTGDEALQRIDKSEARLRAMVEHAPFNIWMCDAEGRLILQNAADVATVGNHVGQLYSEWVDPWGKPSLFSELSRKALSGEVVERVLTYEVGGRLRVFRDILSPAWAGGGIIGSVGVGIDITEQARAEEEQKARLAEKELLLREIHHRVKNNLQVIASLVSLRAEDVSDEPSKEAFLEVQRQVYAIAHVHESLYLSDNLATIDFGDYLRKLADELLALYGGKAVAASLEIDSLYLDIEKAIPCALIANELITNSLKHAFRDRAFGHLAVSLRPLEGGLASMAIEDDGQGIPERGAGGPASGLAGGPASGPAGGPASGPAGGSSLGLLLVSSLAAQLRGSISIGGPSRNRIELRFPLA